MKMITRIAIVTMLFSVFVSANRVMAKTENLTGQNEFPNTPIVSEEIEYALPYPGILPDHPLYLFKQIRDSIMRMFISNPVKQIEFSLLQSDKYLATAMTYADMKKWDRAGQTVIQSQKEMEQAIAGVITARKSDIVVPGHVVVNLERSTVKHTQRIDEMKKLSQEKPGGLFQKASDAFKQLAAQASALREE